MTNYKVRILMKGEEIMLSKYSKMNTVTKIKDVGKFYLGSRYRFIEVLSNQIVLKKGIIAKKYSIENIERIYIEEIKTFLPSRRGSVIRGNKVTTQALIISFKKEYKKRDILIEVDGIDDKVLEKFFECFTFSQDPIFYNDRRNIHLDSSRKLLIGLLVLIVAYVILNIQSGRYINFNKYNLSRGYFFDARTFYEEVQKNNIMNKAKNMEILFIKIENYSQLLDLKMNILNKSRHKDNDWVIKCLEKEYKLKKDNETLYFFIGETEEQKFYYKTTWKKIKTVLRKNNSLEASEKTGLYFIRLDNKYNDYDITFFETT